jgi:hypothetical protein
MSIDEYNEMLSKQNHKCKICKVKLKKPCVDHVHDKTKRVRGILCHNCNVALGLFKDNAIILQSATDYIKQDQESSNNILQFPNKQNLTRSSHPALPPLMVNEATQG